MTEPHDNQEKALTRHAAALAVETAAAIGTAGGIAYAVKLAQNAADATTERLMGPKEELPKVELPPGVDRD